MPELPEVETIKRIIEPQVKGQRILSAEIHNGQIIAHPGVDEFSALVCGNTITGMNRRGKFLSFRFENGDRLSLHLRMTGQLLVTPPDYPMEKHTHLVLRLSGGYQIRYIWWSDDPYIVMFQAVLVQQTAWSSVEKVTQAMKDKLMPEYISMLPTEQLAALIRPCGFSKSKAATIQRLTEWYSRYQYDAEKVKEVSKGDLRKELLGIKGIGAETADVLLVYAFHRTSFIIDTYTRRFLKRLGYDFDSDMQIRAFFENDLPDDYQIYGCYHWLILDHCINRCKKVPICKECFFSKCRNDY